MRMLVVEDDAIIAGHLCPLVVQAGHLLVGLAADYQAAVDLLKTSDVEFALIDIHLADGMTGLQVADMARELGVPFVFTTGNFRLVLDDFHGAVGLVAKPYDDKTITAAIDYLAEALRSGPAAAPPAGLVLSKEWIERLKLGEAQRFDPSLAAAVPDEPETRV